MINKFTIELTHMLKGEIYFDGVDFYKLGVHKDEAIKLTRLKKQVFNGKIYISINQKRFLISQLEKTPIKPILVDIDPMKITVERNYASIKFIYNKDGVLIMRPREIEFVKQEIREKGKILHRVYSSKRENYERMFKIDSLRINNENIVTRRHNLVSAFFCEKEFNKFCEKHLDFHVERAKMHGYELEIIEKEMPFEMSFRIKEKSKCYKKISKIEKEFNLKWLTLSKVDREEEYKEDILKKETLIKKIRDKLKSFKL